jgi:hypothetical protein
MLSNGSKQTFSRCVLHGNRMNKRGVAANFQTYIQPKSPKSSKKQRVSPSLTTRERQFGDMVVRAPAPKPSMEYCFECRYTLPADTSANSNIYDQVFWRSTDSMQDVLHELKSYHKINSFAVDNEHEIEVMA